MNANIKICPSCGFEIEGYRNPIPTVDIIIEMNDKIGLIKRVNPPNGWALPGGFIDYGESVENAAVREAKEETGLDIQIHHLLGVYSSPDRDPRFHTITTVYVATGSGIPTAGDDAQEIDFFDPNKIPETLAFDHSKILKDFIWWKKLSQNCDDHL